MVINEYTKMTFVKYIKIKKKVVCGKMSMYRSYLLKNDFWAKKGNEKEPNGEKVFIKHDNGIGIYATIQNGDKKGVKISVDGTDHFFNNFDKLDDFLTRLRQQQDDFVKILKRRSISQRLRMLDI